MIYVLPPFYLHNNFDIKWNVNRFCPDSEKPRTNTMLNRGLDINTSSWNFCDKGSEINSKNIFLLVLYVKSLFYS